MCSRCSANKAPIKYLQFDRVRVCTACFEGLRKSKLSSPLKKCSLSNNFLPSQNISMCQSCTNVSRRKNPRAQ